MSFATTSGVKVLWEFFSFSPVLIQLNFFVVSRGLTTAVVAAFFKNWVIILPCLKNIILHRHSKDKALN